MKKILSLIGVTTITTSGGAPLMAMIPYNSSSSSSNSNNNFIDKNANINFITKEYTFNPNSFLENEILFDCELNLTEELNINSFEELKENFNGFYFKNFNMYLSVFDKELNQNTYIVNALKPNEYYNYISLSDKNKNNFNLNFYQYKPNRYYEVEIIYNLNFFKKTDDNFYLTMLFRAQGFSENNNSIKLFIKPENIITFLKKV
ncbi:hypothetical protein [Spiroplasma phoeniceum]|uniref:Uncharacterized protein n=1 Tax=Spiroplasma phoeniceum P40 TaxID=1276259 RepID=A0A345DPY2_9MOLU|nr:hypothetical protein [Spiroplasma phoeniceum]AXF96270.1 hypothetical protein SDAV_001303 [Spiroplasma phoeniceum P40]